jgi:cAMP phosphodiesterase
MTVKINSIFEPAFISEVTTLARQCQAEQRKADTHKWDLAERVNSEYPEYAPMFPTKLDYYAAMSQAVNNSLSIGMFTESGQTLRFYCELQATLGNIPNIKALLEASSIDHLRRAKRLASDNKVITDGGQLAGADYAIAKAIEKKFSAEDMEQHFDPKQAQTEYDVIDSSITHMLNPKNWDWIKSADVKDTIIGHVRAIDTIRREYLESEEKAI